MLTTVGRRWLRFEIYVCIVNLSFGGWRLGEGGVGVWVGKLGTGLGKKCQVQRHFGLFEVTPFDFVVWSDPCLKGS